MKASSWSEMIRIGTNRLSKSLLFVAIAYAIGILIFQGWNYTGTSQSKQRLKVQEEMKRFILFAGEKEGFNIEKKVFRLSRLNQLRKANSSKPTMAAANKRGISTKKVKINHQTFLTTRIKCTQKFPLLILVPSGPLNFRNRRVIRQTWGTDHSMNKTWRTMFLLGQAEYPNENKYVISEAAIYGDIVQGNQIDSYYNLTLKVEMGLEWAVNYCDFDFLLKADDDVFVDPFQLIDYLRRPQTPKSWLYLGNVARRSNTRRQGKWGLSYKEYPSDVLPKFCVGPAYVMSRDLVVKVVEIFDTRNPLKLEDVYMGLLMKRLGVTPRRHRGFKTDIFDGRCSYNSNLLVTHEASVNCITKLFNKALEQRFRHTLSTDLEQTNEKYKHTSKLVKRS